MLGIGAMLNMLGGNADTVAAIKAAIGKTIKSVEVTTADQLVFKFENSEPLTMWDDAQSCCEHRYMRTDDDLADFAGAEILDFELSTVDSPSGADDDEWCDAHDVQLLIVSTTKGALTVSNHNEHNGYYGGFAICARLGA